MREFMQDKCSCTQYDRVRGHWVGLYWLSETAEAVTIGAGLIVQGNSAVLDHEGTNNYSIL